MNEKIKQIPYPPESATDKVGKLKDEVLGRMDILEFHEKSVAEFLEGLLKEVGKETVGQS